MSDEALRRGLQGAWDAVASNWGERATEIDTTEAGLTERMLSLAAVHAGDRVLELACGPGGVGLAAAQLGCEVVLSDAAPAMVAVAAERAAGLSGVSTRVLDLEAIDEPDESYDAVVCRHGFMFAVDPAGAVAEIHRVLRPGGRAVLSTWAPAPENRFISALIDAVSEQVGAPVPPPGIPGPFSQVDPERLRELFRSFAEVAVERHRDRQEFTSFDDWFATTSALAGPIALMVGSMPEAERATLRERARPATEPFAGPEGLVFPAVSLVVCATR